MQYADLHWTDDGAPISAGYGDVYFSREGGRAETELVFLEGNGLPERWKQCTNFTIGETGFGSGLNFLHAWARFEETAPQDARLHFISTENAPFSPADLAKAHAAWPELAEYAAKLQAQYPLPITGWHRMHFGRVTLTLGLGDATELLSGIDTNVDAWFLDGFAPAKNPELWNEKLITEIARLSGPGTTLASFTAAGDVRRALEQRGFTIERRDGFGHKRHRIAGVMPGEAKPKMEHPSSAIVIGAGIAGVSAAYALAERGVKVMLLEKAADIAIGASGNEAAVLYPQWTKQPSLQTRWYMSGYAHMQRLLKSPRCGMLKMPKDEKEEARLREAPVTHDLHPDVFRYVEREEASALCGLPVPSGGAWLAQGTWLNATDVMDEWLKHPNISLVTECEVLGLARKDDVWSVRTKEHSFAAPVVVLAAAHDCARFAPQLKIAASAGQVSYIPATEVSTELKAILCHKGYIIPQGDTYLAGATYDHDDTSCAVTEENHVKNRAEIESALPGWLRSKDTSAWQGRTSLRATTPDRMPYVGELEEGLYVSTGHGSRGMLSAPLAAECIASWAMGEMAPLPHDVLAAVDPLRKLRLPERWPALMPQAATG